MNKIFEPFIRRARTLPRTQLLICLSLFDNACDQDGYIWESDQSLAAKVGTTVPYLRECIAKMTRSGILTRHPQFGNLYRFTYIPLSVQYERGNHYCKTYSLLYSPSFRQLPVNAMRIILEALFELSKTGHTTVVMSEERFYTRTGFSHLALDRYARFEELLSIIEEICKDYVQLNRLTKYDPLRRRDEKFVQFTFSPEGLVANSYQKEYHLLESSFVFAGLHDFVMNEANIIAILKEQKARFALAEKLIERDQDLRMQGEHFIELSRRVLRHAYNEAVERFIGVLKNNPAIEVDTPERIQAYFSTVYQDVLREEFQVITKDYYTRLSLLSDFVEQPAASNNPNLYTKFSPSFEENGFKPFTHEEFARETKPYACLMTLLKEMLYSWVKSRLSNDAVGHSKLARFPNKEDAVSYVKSICTKEADSYTSFKERFRGLFTSLGMTAKISFATYREDILEIQRNALSSLNSLFAATG